MNLKSISFYLALVALWSERPAFAGPTLSKTEPAPSASVPALTTIKVTFNEAVTGVDANDLVINAEAAAEVSGSGKGPYEFTFTQPLPGDVAISWDFDHGIAGVSGSGAYTPETGWTYQLMDTLPPGMGTVRAGQKLESIVPLPGSTVDRLTQVEVRFSEVVTGIDAGDLTIDGDNAIISDSVTGEGAGPYIFTFPTEPAAGTVTFRWVSTAGIVDLAGNPFDTAQSWTTTLAPGKRGEVQITEFMAANASGLMDTEEDTSDWIELYNPGTETVDLAGWSRSSVQSHPAKSFPPTSSIPHSESISVMA